MLLSVKWLLEFVPFKGNVDELAERLTMLGLEVEEVVRPFSVAAQAVVGHVLTCERHPQADKLSVCTVDVGDGEPLPIVCGAPNVAQGQKIALAPVGATMANGMTLKKAKLRGEPSMGMICAEDELGLGESHDGIMVLDPELPVGTNLVQALDLDDVVLDVSVTPNRADCLSVLGMAREVAMAWDLPLTMPEIKLSESGPDAADLVKVTIDDPETCPVYQARVLQNVKVGPSPARIRYRLAAVGVRPISNIVDATNYVMMELGQPLHAFDRALVAGNAIRVAPATDGLKFKTLDDQERSLLASDLLIWDAEKPVALAGVMGGLNSEMNQDSSEVLLESAVFKPALIRKTARRLSLPSEASYRFERGVDQPGSLVALDRAAQLMAELSGATVCPGVAKAEPTPHQPRSLTFRVARARDLLGIPLDDDFCKKTLQGMGCEVETGPVPYREEWAVSIPSHRLDLEREVDLVEEVARVYGMDRIPAVLPRVSKALEALEREDTAYDFTMALKNWGRGVGLNEAINYSFVGQTDLDLLGLPKDDRVPVKNPLSEDQNVLRTRLAPGLLNSLRNNLAQGATRLRIFETAKLFLADPESDTTATEPARLGILVYGPRNEEFWPWLHGEDAGYADVKGLLEHLLNRFGLDKAEFQRAEKHPYLEPCVNATLGGKHLGEIGMVRPDVADAYHARKEVWLAEIDADLVRAQYEAAKPGFDPLPVFPPVRRDVTFIAPPDLSVADVLAAVRQTKEALLEEAVLADVYQPEDGSERSLTVRLTYRHAQKTLKDKEVDKRHAKLVKTITKTLPVRV